jgi:hypothetical protein
MRLTRTAAGYHEAGHFVVAENYDLEPFALLRELADGWTGTTFYQRATPHTHAVIGWAGLIAEQIPILDDKKRHQENSVVNLENIYHALTHEVMREQGDCKFITAIPQEQWRETMNHSYSIVFERIERVRQVARIMIETNVGYGKIETFLADHAMSEEKLREILTGQPEKTIQTHIEHNRRNLDSLQAAKAS